MSSQSPARPNPVFDWLFIVFAGIWTAGVFLDGWAHIHLPSTRETFFTLWHGFFYGGMALTGAILFFELFRNHSRGFPWKYALPREYFFALSGLAVAFCAGAGDLAWHEVFGIEIGVEALLSPTHLLLAMGGAIAVGGPYHAVWYRHRDHPLHALPTILSGTYFMSVVLFMLQFLNPFNFPWMAASFYAKNPIYPDYAAGLGIAGIIIFTGIFMGFVLSSIRHWQFPPGSFAAILGLNVLAMTLMHGEYYTFIYSGIVAGGVIDGLYWLLSPKHGGEKNIRLFSFLSPVVLFSAYFVVLFAVDSVLWSVHLLAGSIILSGITGYLMSYLVIAPHEKSFK